MEKELLEALSFFDFFVNNAIYSIKLAEFLLSSNEKYRNTIKKLLI